jgi:prepilin-type N-terminal cleavage/methylation domain-containing protein
MQPPGTPGGSHARGFTLIELTVVLAVIVTLALILTPSIANIINDARVARARSDSQTLVGAIVQFYKDNGFFPQWATASGGGPGTAQSRVDLLVSRGNIPAEDQPSPWTTGRSDLLSNQLLINAPVYTLKAPSSQFGWNGPYLSPDLGADPWGNRYVVNVGLIDVTAGPLGRNGAPKSAVWVLSAGSNGIIETLYSQLAIAATLGGDDIGIRIQ